MTDPDPMRRRQPILFIVVTALLGLILHACGETEPPTEPLPLPQVRSDLLGPFGVGVTTRLLPAVDGGENAEPFAVEVWYPVDPEGPWKSAAAGRTPLTGLLGMGVRDLPVLRGYHPFPVVIFSHGLAAIREQSNFQVQHLVSRGYVVLSADHHPSLLFEIALGDRTTQVISSALNRPLEVIAQMDAVAEWAVNPRDPVFFGSVDPERFLVMGHSFGGFTALSVSGAKADFNTLVEICATDAALEDELNCRFVDDYDGETREFIYNDPRVVAIMPLTPGATTLFDRGGLDSVKIPVFLWAGEIDDLVDPDLFVDWVYEDLQSPKLYATIPGADHLDFSQICQAALPFGCGLDGPYTPQQILGLINDLTAAFSDWVMQDNSDARARLAPAAVQQRYPRLIYQTDF